MTRFTSAADTDLRHPVPTMIGKNVVIPVDHHGEWVVLRTPHQSDTRRWEYNTRTGKLRRDN